jgi:hypothetical protein
MIGRWFAPSKIVHAMPSGALFAAQTPDVSSYASRSVQVRRQMGDAHEGEVVE